ncbi:MAG TPA: hypothetical protein VHB98_23195 [Chloroflexota bacterium]|nr:hypothetical protein [Chloroflexota bacterium]
MTNVFSRISALIGLFYIGVILRALYPKSGSATPPLPVKLSGAGIDPEGGSFLPWQRA